MKVSNPIKILFTSIGRRVELVQMFRDAARRMGVQLELVGADISDTAPALWFCDRIEIVPRISDPAYIPQLLRICEERKITALIPTIDTDLKLLALHKDAFAQIGTHLLVSDAEKVSICRDKRLTAEYFKSLGLETPMPVDNLRDYKGGFPAFIKPLDGSSSIGASRVDTMRELESHAQQLDQYIIQPFVSGTEYTVDILGDLSGNAVYITPRIRQAVRSGEVLKTKIHHQKSIVQEMLRLVEDFKPVGQITVQLIRSEEENKNQYIEINPRFGGGAPLSAKAGADSAEAILRMLSSESLSYKPFAAEEGAVYSRFDQSVCVKRDAPVPVKAVIFDLDDTLYPEKDYVKSGFAAVAACLPQIPQAEEKLWDAFCKGEPAIDSLLEQAGISDQKIKLACLTEYREHIPQIQLYTGMSELLIYLRQRNVKIGIVTDGRPDGQRRKIAALGLSEQVDRIIVTDELGGEKFRKPNDIAFRILQTCFDVPYEQMIYIGDNLKKDFQAPKMLGMQWLHFHNADGIYYDPCNTEEMSVNSPEALAKRLMQITRES